MADIQAESPLAAVLEREGLHATLKLLNARTPYRYTGVYRFDGDMLRNVALFDRQAPAQVRGQDRLLGETYCAITGRLNDALLVSDGKRDTRYPWMRAHDVLSYCGVPIRDAAGVALGTLCHFDHRSCPVEGSEAAFLLCIAEMFRPFVA